MRAQIFTTPTCIKCASLKKEIEKLPQKIDIEYIDATTPEGSEKAGKLGVRSAPTVFLFDDQNEQIGVAYDIDEFEELLEAV